MKNKDGILLLAVYIILLPVMAGVYILHWLYKNWNDPQPDEIEIKIQEKPPEGEFHYWRTGDGEVIKRKPYPWMVQKKRKPG